MTKKLTTLPVATVQRIIKEETDMMVSQELAEYETMVLTKRIRKRARKIKLYADHHKKKILKKEMAEFLDRTEEV